MGIAFIFLSVLLGISSGGILQLLAKSGCYRLAPFRGRIYISRTSTNSVKREELLDGQASNFISSWHTKSNKKKKKRVQDSHSSKVTS